MARGEYDNMKVEAIRGNIARKGHNKNSGITQRQLLRRLYQILANNEHDQISQVQLIEEYPSTTGFVPGVQEECRNSHQNFPKSEKQHQRRIINNTYDPVMVMNETHGQKIQIQNVVELKKVTYRQPIANIHRHFAQAFWV